MSTSRFRCPELRKGRYSAAGQIYMITTVTDCRVPYFHNFYSGRLLVEALRQTECSVDTLAFVVMPDHLHWLMQLKEGYSLGQVVHFVKSASARRVNSALNRTGRFWGRGYYDHALRTPEAALDCARYIVANPLRAGLVGSIGDYPLWDSAWLGD